MLVSIAVIGIIAGIAITSLSQPQRETMAEGTRRHNAASLATMATCVEVAGVKAVVPNDIEATIRRLATGITPTVGALAGHRFVVSGIPADEVPHIARYLSIETGELVYHPEPTPPVQ